MSYYPYKNIDPFKMPETADKILNEYWGIAKSLNVKTFLVYGTCLGFVRNSGYIIGDNDIDVGILGEIGEIAVKLTENGFIKKGDGPRNYHFLKYEILLDVFFEFPDWLRKFLQSFDKVTYKGRVYNVPHPVEEFLEVKYGDWKIEKHREFDPLDCSGGGKF